MEKETYELEPRHDNAKSFYGKARVEVKGNNQILYSYNTKVAEIQGTKTRVYNTHTQTTLRHIKEFLKQMGRKAETKTQIEKDYIVGGLK